MARRHRNAWAYGGDSFRIQSMIAQIFTLVLITNVIVTQCSHNETDELTSIKSNIPKKIKILEAFMSKGFFSDVYQNGTFRTGNNLWDNILNKCSLKPSVSCLQKNFYSYLDDSLDFNGDISVAGGVSFKKNNVDMKKYSKEANIIYLTGSKNNGEHARTFEEENEIRDDEEPETPFEEVTDALYSKGMKFLMTHDMSLTLPEMLFDGATLKVSPRALTKNGALVHIDLEPKKNAVGEGRIFFHKITKKMFLKILLFLFPALSHIFKLCSWYHQNYHTTKYHHHHHLITHHHKVPHGHHPHGYGPPSHGSVVVKQHAESPPPSFDHYPQDWELSGPGLGSEYLSDIHRNAIAGFKPNENDVNDINSWGLGLPPGPSLNVGEYASGNTLVPNTVPGPNLNAGQKVMMTGNTGRPVGPPNPYYRHKKTESRDPATSEKEALIRAATLAARAPPSPVRDELLRVSAAKLSESNRVKMETDLVKQQQEILAQQDPDSIAAEKFYGSLLERVDAILGSIGAKDAGCKERAVCALYRDPFKHAPYSNLVSNELSKDSNELVPPADSTMALHYFRYVQAARDGQESKDCALLYPTCNVDYSNK
ncbi:uncharacterized protein Osi17 isoform X2 [Maniola hyperantus]|uniref:uncharacterized protein Osi17 isoform X2 n=1 Tax=Aphantopus hyperantus TaxID=2795564 RepID=UPI0037483039